MSSKMAQLRLNTFVEAVGGIAVQVTHQKLKTLKAYNLTVDGSGSKNALMVIFENGHSTI